MIGEHYLIEEMREIGERLDTLREEHDKLYQKFEAERKEAFNNFQPRYKYDILWEDNSFRVHRLLANIGDAMELERIFGQSIGVNEVAISVRYCIINHVLVRTGSGGYLLLRNPIILTKEQEEMIHKGEVPHELLI